MSWMDVIELITVTHTDDIQQDENGLSLWFYPYTNVIVTETARQVFANKKSVVRSEFYPAIANNLKPTATFEIYAFEYLNEQKLRHEGTDYIVIRTYSKNKKTLELVCQAFYDVQANLARLRDTIEVWHNTIIENSMSERSPSAALFYTLPAQIEYKGGGSGTTGASNTIVTETTNNATVTISYRDGITPDMFLKINDVRWDIQFIEDPYNRHETLILHVERKQP